MKKLLFIIVAFSLTTVSLQAQDSAATSKQNKDDKSGGVSDYLTFATVNEVAIKLKHKFSLVADEREGYGDFASYLSKDGVLYKVGDTLTLGFPSSNKSFAFIVVDEGHFFKLWNNTGLTYADVSSSQSLTVIKNIKIAGSKKGGYYVTFRCYGATGTLRFQVQFENAIQVGEIKRAGMTSDEALTELKRWKDKLDLGLITQAEFDQKKKELAKLIK